MGRVFVTGDKHGSAMNIRYTMNLIDNPQEDDIIIICGDAGFEYEDHIMGSAKKEAKKFPGKWIVLRGNHDSRYWSAHTENNDDHPKDGWSITYLDDAPYLYQNKYPNIFYLPDEGCIYRIGEYNILFVPGAYSVDKYYRQRMGYVWNPREQLTAEEMTEMNNIVKGWNEAGFDIDFVIGHTFPMKIQPYYQYLFMEGLDQELIDKSMEKWLDTLALFYEKNPAFKQYFGGHFHDDKRLTDKYTMLYHQIVDLADYMEE